MFHRIATSHEGVTSQSLTKFFANVSNFSAFWKPSTWFQSNNRTSDLVTLTNLPGFKSPTCKGVLPGAKMSASFLLFSFSLHQVLQSFLPLKKQYHEAKVMAVYSKRPIKSRQFMISRHGEVQILDLMTPKESSLLSLGM